MSVQVNYKGSTIAAITNGTTKTLNTAGTWVEGGYYCLGYYIFIAKNSNAF